MLVLVNPDGWAGLVVTTAGSRPRRRQNPFAATQLATRALARARCTASPGAALPLRALPRVTVLRGRAMLQRHELMRRPVPAKSPKGQLVPASLEATLALAQRMPLKSMTVPKNASSQARQPPQSKLRREQPLTHIANFETSSLP
jgi:hypothetical protein